MKTYNEIVAEVSNTHGMLLGMLEQKHCDSVNKVTYDSEHEMPKFIMKIALDIYKNQKEADDKNDT